MRLFRIVLVSLCSAVLACALVGCGGGASGNKDKFVGSWDLVSLNGTDGSSSTTSADIELMKSQGLYVALNLNEDGSASFDLFGEKLDGTWEAKDDTTGTLTLNNQSITMTIDASDKLSLEQEGSVMVFEKGAANAASASSTATATSSAPAAESASSTPATSSTPAADATSSAV